MRNVFCKHSRVALGLLLLKKKARDKNTTHSMKHALYHIVHSKEIATIG